MEEDKTKSFVRKRAAIKGTITKMENSFIEGGKAFSKQELMLKEERLRKAFQTYEDFTLEICALQPDFDTDDDGVEEKYIKTLTIIKELLCNMENVPSNDKSCNIKLPTITVPMYSGKYSDYKPFIGLFNSLIHNNSKLDEVQKFFYLRSFLQGEPYDLVKNLTLCSESYHEARKILADRYDNKYKITNEHIHILLDIVPISRSTAINIRNFLSVVKQQLAALKNLGHAVGEWDPIILCILTRKLDTLCSREFQLAREKEPTVENLIHFLEKRALALENAEQRPDGPQPASKMAHVAAVKPRSSGQCSDLGPAAETSAVGVKSCLLCGGCNFPEGWTGGWFQSGIPGLIYINSTTMQGKGECAETDSNDKFLVYDRNEDCYRCLVIHEKHKYVLQYKETYCGQRDSLSTMCESITGDAALYSMFRKEPRPLPQPCPFHPAPFTFTYSRGSGDCVNPPSRAESCTDDARLLLRYMACPDVPGTESNVEELICLATWKEGSTRYLVGLISQVQRRNSISTDEDMYRCFVYKGSHADKTVTYNIAQSGDATCNGLISPVDGSRTMKLTNIDDEHNRCHFPSWVVEHHKWFSLDHTHQYHFTTKNATLKIMNADGSYDEKRLVCHSILEQKDKKLVKLVAHLTRGCESGHVCVILSGREGGVLELQLGGALHDAPHDACALHHYTPHVTLITTSVYPVRCPILGRYTVVDSLADRRRRRQQLTIDDSSGTGLSEQPVECVMGQYDSASIGCGAQQDTIEFHSACTSTEYTCYGGWREGNVGLLVAGLAKAPRPTALCFIYTTYVNNDSLGVPVQYLSISAVSRSCDRAVLPGVAGDKAYNLTINGTCEQSSKYNSAAVRVWAGALLLPRLLLPALLLLLAAS